MSFSEFQLLRRPLWPLLALGLASCAQPSCSRSLGSRTAPLEGETSSLWGDGGGNKKFSHSPSSSKKSGAPSANTLAARRANGAIGFNLTRATYYGGAWPFVDVMKHSEPWLSGRPEHPDPNKRWSDGAPVDLTKSGWVKRLHEGQIARKFIFGDGSHFPPGKYIVTYAGKGSISYQGGSLSVTKGDGRDEVVIGAGGSLWLELTAVEPTDPLRDIHIIAPGGRCQGAPLSFCQSDGDCQTSDASVPARPIATGTESNLCQSFLDTFKEEPFHPIFLNDIASARVLRFMDWMDTNRPAKPHDGEAAAHPLVTFADFPKKESSSYYPVPLEIIADLANTVQADAWITLPHTASDELIEQAAQLFKEKLNPELKLYVEYSNEVWNSQFGQWTYAGEKGCRRFSNNVRECDSDGDGDLCEVGPWDSAMEKCALYGRRYFAHRTAQVAAIFERVFGAQARSRLVKVAAWQTGSLIDSGLELLREPIGEKPFASTVDVFAVAPYFGVGIDVMPSADAFFARIEEPAFGAPAGTFSALAVSPDGKEAGPYFYMKNDSEVLRQEPELAHLRLVGYEGGQHLFSFHDGQTAQIIALNQDPRMKELYAEYLNAFARFSGGEVMAHYSSPGGWWKHGAFGSKQWQGQPNHEAPKHAALEEFARTGPQ